MPAVKKVVLITSGQPSINPRLVKEADALADAGFDVTVLYAYWNSWATTADQSFLQLKKWKHLRVAGDPVTHKFLYNISRALYKLSLLLYNYTRLAFFANMAVARSSFWFTKAAKKHPAHLYIAHNLGALPAAVIAAKANRALCGFDAEDFHRGETNADAKSTETLLKVAIENTYIPQTDYFTTSSPQIADAYHQVYPFLKPLVLLNVFPKTALSVKEDMPPKQTRLFWFSQTIGFNRGLEDVINALQFLNNRDIELHLLGSSSTSSQPILDLIKQANITVLLHNPLPPHQLIDFCSQFDIGLALEPGFSPNNNMALSNKLFTYMQAGITTIASDTLAQKEFINQYPATGRLYKIGNYKALAELISFYHTNKQELIKAKKAALQLARNEFNWQLESDKFLGLIHSVLAKGDRAQ